DVGVAELAGAVGAAAVGAVRRSAVRAAAAACERDREPEHTAHREHEKDFRFHGSTDIPAALRVGQGGCFTAFFPPEARSELCLCHPACARVSSPSLWPRRPRPLNRSSPFSRATPAPKFPTASTAA